jgi:SAM-dependent methyltransferase
MATGSLSSSAPLAAFIEPFIEGRRALVFGSALATTPRLLLERGARLVHVCDPAPLRVAEAVERAAAPGLSFSTFSDEVLASRDGSFDCVLVENLGAFDARAVVARARRLLAPRGVALFVTPNREATTPLLPPPEPTAAPLDYYALYDLVAGEFEHVRMLGQAPFVGYAVVDFAPEAAPEPLIDSEFIPRGSEEPELFVALASRHRTGLAGYAVIQLPLHRVLSGSAVSPRAALPAEEVLSVDLARKLKQQEGWITELESRAETADERADRAEEELERLRAELAKKSHEPPRLAPPPLPPPPAASFAPDPARERALAEERKRRLELEQENARLRELEPAAHKLRELEARLAQRDASTGELEARATTHATRLAERDGRLAELERTVAERNARLAELERTVAERNARLAELERTVAERNARLAELERTVAERNTRVIELERTSAEADTSEVDRLERQLTERGHELRRLERAVAEAERVGRELVAERERTPHGGDPELSRKLDLLSDRLATSEADRLALTWSAAVPHDPH